MPSTTRTGRGGLLTDPNKLLGLDALVRADNVYAEADGVLRVRPGFGQQTVKSTTRRIRRLFSAFNASVVYAITTDSGTPGIETLSGTLTGNPVAPGSNHMLYDAAEARGNWYLTSNLGPVKLTSAADTATEVAGLRRALTGVLALSSAGTPNAMPTAKAVAYRWCIVREDAGGLVLRSEPSPWQSIENTSGSTRDVTCVIPLAGDVVAGDRIELYRTASVASGSTPSDECFLVQSYTVVSGDVTAEYATLTDVLAETNLGRALYTNPTREGILRANGRPPVAAQLALFSSCMWFGCMSGAHQLQVRVNGSASAADGRTNIIARNDTGTTTATVATIDIGPVDMNGVRAGQYVWTTDQANPSIAGTIFAANTVITGIAGTVITVSPAPIGSSGVPITIYISDSVTVDSVVYWAQVQAAQTTAMAGNRLFAVSTSGAPTATVYCARNLAFAISYYSDTLMATAIEEPGSARATLLLERELMTGTSFTISTTAPQGILPLEGTDLTSDTWGSANALYYSKPDEPEHVPALNYVVLGSESNRIVRLVPMSGALLAWTTEGLYRISGAAPDQWRVDMADPSARLLRGELCDVMHGTCYAMTSRGLVTADANGIGDLLSAGAIQRELEEYLPSIDDAPEDHDDGVYMTCWPSRDLVVIGITDGSADAAQLQLAHAVTARSWAKWTRTDRAMVAVKNGVYAARAGSLWEVRFAQDANVSTADVGYDRSYTSLTWTANGTTTVTITAANAGTWTPTAGDWLSASNGSTTVWRRILTSSLGGGTYTLTLDAALESSYSTSRTGYEGVVVRLQYHALSASQALIARELQLHLDTSDYAASDASTLTDYRVTGGAGTEYAADTITAVATLTRSATRSQRLRFGMPRAVARAQHLYASVSFSEIMSRRLAVEGVTIVYSGAGERGVTRS